MPIQHISTVPWYVINTESFVPTLTGSGLY